MLDGLDGRRVDEGQATAHPDHQPGHRRIGLARPSSGRPRRRAGRSRRPPGCAPAGRPHRPARRWRRVRRGWPAGVGCAAAAGPGRPASCGRCRCMLRATARYQHPRRAFIGGFGWEVSATVEESGHGCTSGLSASTSRLSRPRRPAPVGRPDPVNCRSGQEEKEERTGTEEQSTSSASCTQGTDDGAVPSGRAGQRAEQGGCGESPVLLGGSPRFMATPPSSAIGAVCPTDDRPSLPCQPWSTVPTAAFGPHRDRLGHRAGQVTRPRVTGPGAGRAGRDGQSAPPLRRNRVPG